MANTAIYNNFRRKNIQAFMESLDQDDNTLYLGIGRPYFWNLSDGSDTPVLPAINSVKNEILDWEDIMSLKRIFGSDTSIGFNKKDWVPGKAYDRYRIDWDGTRKSNFNNTYPTSIGTSASVVIVNTSDVYVCIKTPRPAIPSDPTSIPLSLYAPNTGAPISDAPSTSNVVRTADGYYWKYIASLSASLLIKFTSATSTQYPIQTVTTPPPSTDFLYDQYVAQVKSASHKGGIYAIDVLNGGAGYNNGKAGTLNYNSSESNPFFSISGNGSGLKCKVTFSSGGAVSDIEVTDPGYGYTWAFITLSNTIPVQGNGFNYDIGFSTPTGLGTDPVNDVDAVYLLLSCSLTGDESNKFTIQNGYRKIVLIHSPTTWNSTAVATAAKLSAMTTLRLNKYSVEGSFTASSSTIITGDTSGSKWRLVDYNQPAEPDSPYIRVIKMTTGSDIGASQNLLSEETIKSSEGLGEATIAEIIPPDVALFSGDILYVENRQQILRTEDQSETIRVILQY